MILAIDYGDVRIGIAITDTDEHFALAHSIIPAQPEDEAIQSLLTLLQTEHVSHLVVGLPLLLDGTEGEQAHKTRAFVERLLKGISIPHTFLDERFTSAQGKDVARVKGHASPDAEAARLLLQTFLDQKRNA